MRYLRHDSGEKSVLQNTQVLGDDSPLEFDDEGRAGPVKDSLAEKVAAMHKYVHLGRRVREGDEPEEDEGFDAETFVDRTPMDDVVDDIESGEYDDHLDEIEAEAERQGVIDAVDERRE